MSEEEIFSKVQSIVAETLGNEQEKITLNANFYLDLGADYLDLIAMFMMLEDIFNAKIPYEETKQFVTIQQVVNYISRKVFV